MSGLAGRRCHVLPGDGVVGRWPGVVLFVPPGVGAQAVIDDLMTRLGDDPTPRSMRDAVAALAQDRSDVALAAVVDADDGPDALWAMAIGGAVVVAGSVTVGGSPGTLHQSAVRADATGIVLRPSAFAAAVAQSGDLRLGLVPGSGARIAPEREPSSLPPEPAESSVPEPEVEVGDQSFELVDFAERVEDRAPLPVLDAHAAAPSASAAVATSAAEVRGVLCSRDHFNNPLAAYCVVCGISMIHRTAVLVRGPRPTLGFVVFDDGSTYALDRSYVIGREPEPRDGAVPLVADDDHGSVSRSHAELRLVDWDVTFSDLGSTNGSFVWSREVRQWSVVGPDSPVVLQPGQIAAVGRRTFTYESVHRTGDRS